jgi:hypothetical protein
MTIPFQTTNWDLIEETVHPGETGHATWKTIQYNGLRIRQVNYSPNYLADHWCEKGHLIYCIKGEMITKLADGTEHVLRMGMTYQVSDNMSMHKTYTTSGVELLIIDGDFLK